MNLVTLQPGVSIDTLTTTRLKYDECFINHTAIIPSWSIFNQKYKSNLHIKLLFTEVIAIRVVRLTLDPLIRLPRHRACLELINK